MRYLAGRFALGLSPNTFGIVHVGWSPWKLKLIMIFLPAGPESGTLLTYRHTREPPAKPPYTGQPWHRPALRGEAHLITIKLSQTSFRSVDRPRGITGMRASEGGSHILESSDGVCAIRSPEKFQSVGSSSCSQSLRTFIRILTFRVFRRICSAITAVLLEEKKKSHLGLQISSDWDIKCNLGSSVICLKFIVWFERTGLWFAAV